MPRKTRTLGGTLLAAVLLACGLWHLHVLNRWMAGRSDLLPPYIAARVALTHGDPYAASTTAEIQKQFYGKQLRLNEPGDKQAFAYPFYTVFLLAPIAWLPWQAARWVFCLLAIPAIAIAAARWLRLYNIRPPKSALLLYFAFTLVSWPVLVALRHQQLTILIFLLITTATVALNGNRQTLAGICLGLLIFKPQLVVLLFLWIFTRAIFHRQARLFAAFFATVAVQLLASFALRPTWLQQWLTAIADYRRYTGGVPSLQIFFGPIAGGFMLAAVTVVAVIALVRSLKRRDTLALSVAILLALTVALLPTSVHWIYNQVLLIPGCLFLIASKPVMRSPSIARGVSLFCLAISFLTVPLAVIIETLSHPSNLVDFLPYFNLFLPSCVAVALALSVMKKADDRAL